MRRDAQGGMEMELKQAIEGIDIKKKFRGFTLDIPKCSIPKGFATALIGENGSGKTTFLNILAGIRLDYKGRIVYFDEKESDVEKVRERVGYTGPGCFFLPHWNRKQVAEVSKLLFESFDANKYDDLCDELGIIGGDKTRRVSELSDGNRMKLALAAVMARDTECLVMDEPASPLDPLMRDRLCGMIQEYLEAGQGQRSVLFSTHNIADMENVTDYCLIMEQGRIVEQGFVEDLKEKYLLIKGEAKDAQAAERILYSFSKSPYGFEGLCLTERLDQLAGMDIQAETPTLFQISVAVMKANSQMQYRHRQGVGA